MRNILFFVTFAPFAVLIGCQPAAEQATEEAPAEESMETSVERAITRSSKLSRPRGMPGMPRQSRLCTPQMLIAPGRTVRCTRGARR